MQGLNKYGTPAEKKKFEDWLCCYGKAKKGKVSGGYLAVPFFFQTRRNGVHYLTRDRTKAAELCGISRIRTPERYCLSVSRSRGRETGDRSSIHRSLLS